MRLPSRVPPAHPDRGGASYRRRLVAMLSVAVIALVLTTQALAQPPPPVLTQPVNDFARVIDPDGERELERLILALQNASGDVVVIATVPTFQPYADIKEYAVKMFENSGKGIGGRSKDNGLLIVVAVEDRKVSIEVGYGIEPFITDGYAGQTIRQDILPAFRAGQYGKGLIAGTTRIINRIADQRGVTLTDVPRPAAEPEPARGRGGSGFPVGLVFVIVILVIMLMQGRTGRRRRRHWGGGPWSGWNSGIGPFGGGGGFGGFGGGFGGFGGGGGSSGGFGGFGGGRSGGGGASGGW